MSSGRNRYDRPLNQWFSRQEQADPQVLQDTISEVPGAVEQVEDDPPKLNKGTGTAVDVGLPCAVAVQIVPGSDERYIASKFHGYTVVCMSRTPKQIVAANDQRTRVTLVNNGGSGTLDVNIGADGDEARADGYPLADGATVTLETTAEIWGFVRTNTAADNVVVGVLVEYAWRRQ